MVTHNHCNSLVGAMARVSGSEKWGSMENPRLNLLNFESYHQDYVEIHNQQIRSNTFYERIRFEYPLVVPESAFH